MIGRKRALRRSISISAAIHVAIHDGTTLPSASAAFVLLAPRSTYDLATVRDAPLSRSLITDMALTGTFVPVNRSMLVRKLAASSRSSDANGINPTSPASVTLLKSILLDQSIEDISDRISFRIVLPFYVPQPIISAARTLAVQQLTATYCPRNYWSELARSRQLRPRQVPLQRN